MKTLKSKTTLRYWFFFLLGKSSFRQRCIMMWQNLWIPAQFFVLQFLHAFGYYSWKCWFLRDLNIWENQTDWIYIQLHVCGRKQTVFGICFIFFFSSLFWIDWGFLMLKLMRKWFNFWNKTANFHAKDSPESSSSHAGEIKKRGKCVHCLWISMCLVNRQQQQQFAWSRFD